MTVGAAEFGTKRLARPTHHALNKHHQLAINHLASITTVFFIFFFFHISDDSKHTHTASMAPQDSFIEEDEDVW